MSTANYPAVLAFTLRYEGGRVDNPKDPGGRTNKGVTQKTYDWFRNSRGMGNGDVYLMADDEMAAIYAEGYWNTVGGDALPAGPDLAVFDLGVNSGPSRAMSYLAAVGGLVAAIKDAVGTTQAICAKRLSFLHALGTFQTFGRGWTARVAACEALGVKMALNFANGASPSAPTHPLAVPSLQDHADKAAKKSAVHKKVATGTGVGGAGAAVGTSTQVPQAAHLPISVIVVIVVIVAAVAGFFAWRAFIHSKRAAAYSAVAKV